MGKLIDETGNRYGTLAVLSRAASTGAPGARWRCACDCGKLLTVLGSSLRKGATRSCGCSRKTLNRGSDNPKWRGGRWVHRPGGYMKVHAPDHPYSVAGYVYEHRLVMEKYLGRLLFKGENVHHINGDRLDNRIENLELWDTTQPAGQRVEDKIRYAEELLARYRPRKVRIRHKVRV